MSAPRPNLFVIGASKCGASFMHDLLGQHPAIFMSRIKEPFHFNRSDRDDRVAEYLLLFSDGAANHMGIRHDHRGFLSQGQSDNRPVIAARAGSA